MGTNSKPSSFHSPLLVSDEVPPWSSLLHWEKDCSAERSDVCLSSVLFCSGERGIVQLRRDGVLPATGHSLFELLVVCRKNCYTVDCRTALFICLGVQPIHIMPNNANTAFLKMSWWLVILW